MKTSAYPCPCTLCDKPILTKEAAFEIRTKKKTDSGRSHYIHVTCWARMPKYGDKEVVK